MRAVQISFSLWFPQTNLRPNTWFWCKLTEYSQSSFCSSNSTESGFLLMMLESLRSMICQILSWDPYLFPSLASASRSMRCKACVSLASYSTSGSCRKREWWRNRGLDSTSYLGAGRSARVSFFHSGGAGSWWTRKYTSATKKRSWRLRRQELQRTEETRCLRLGSHLGLGFAAQRPSRQTCIAQKPQS